MEKSETFALHLFEVFQPNSYSNFGFNNSNIEETIIQQRLSEPYQLDLPIKKFTKNDVNIAISKLKSKKAPGYDLITNKVIKELPEVAIRFITQLFNAVMRLGFFPPQWKVAEIKMIHKPGKPTSYPKSYRPISLLPMLSKLMEILFVQKLLKIVDEKELIPAHQFGFRKQHSTVEQVHRLVQKIHTCYEAKHYCTTAFLDISQAFDRVWHEGLLYKLRSMLPTNYYVFIKSYLENRCFYVNCKEEHSTIYHARAGVPQGSVMGPILYLLFTADLPVTNQVLVGTFADDTAIVASDPNPIIASQKLQNSLDRITDWLNKWRIKSNETKSVQVTFTTRKDTCPPVKLNGIELSQSNEAKYLGIHLDRKLTWRKHIFTKRKALGLKLRTMYWLLGSQSQLKLHNKLLLYKSILKPIWTYGIQLWGTAANSNIEILQRFQSKLLRIISNAPFYVTNAQLHRDLKINTINDEIKAHSTRYQFRIQHHPNQLASTLATSARFVRLKRKTPLDLAN